MHFISKLNSYLVNIAKQNATHITILKSASNLIVNHAMLYVFATHA